MASDKMVPITAQLPSEDDDQLNPFTMNDSQIMDLISATHIVNPADEKFDADSLFVVVKNILRRSTNIVDNVLQEHLENLEEEVSRISFNPLLRTLKQLIHEMACKAPGVEIAHKTTMLILDKLSSYSWDAKAVLILATFALDYEDFLVPHSSHQLIESMEIPKHVPATLKHSDIQKYGKTICELNKIINNMLDVIESVFEVKKLHYLAIEDERSSIYKLDAVNPVDIYWIIITVIACTTQMYCLKSDEDNTQELLPFAQKISDTHSIMLSLRWFNIETLKERRKMKELLQTPDEIIEVFKALIFAKDDMQPLIDGSTSKMISIDVLKKKKVLSLISGLDISMDDISILKSIYDGIREKRYDEYKIVWIPIVEQWTDGLQKKFEMLRSKMPWYIVQYFSPLAGIKFIKEAWHFKNRPIVVVMNSQGDVFNENALYMMKNRGMDAFPFGEEQAAFFSLGVFMRPRGPYAIEEYTFFCGGNDNRWIEQFSEKVNVLAEDPITKEAYIFIELSCVGKSRRKQHFWIQYQTRKKTNQSDPGNQEIQKLLLSFKNESRWAVLTKWSTRVVSDHGTTILKVLEAFEEWKVNVPEKGFEICFKEYHDKFLKTGPLPSTS